MSIMLSQLFSGNMPVIFNACLVASSVMQINRSFFGQASIIPSYEARV